MKETVTKPLDIQRPEEDESEEVAPMVEPPAGPRGGGLPASVSSSGTGYNRMAQEPSQCVEEQGQHSAFIR